MEKIYLGVELGSTRIKAVLATRNGKVKSVAAYHWENILTDGLWSYPEGQFAKGLQSCLADCLSNYEGTPVIAGMGVSAMMHGYIALDKNGDLLVPFRTWRNTNTGAAAEELTTLFGFNIPLRWSISHLYQSILNDEPHVKDIAYVTTLSGYIHYKLTGEKVLGIGDASGMFPIDERTGDFCGEMLEKFDTLIADKNYPWKIRDILPKVLKAGEKAGSITAEGAKYLGIPELSVGLPLCPPEGDAETGDRKSVV